MEAAADPRQPATQSKRGSSGRATAVVRSSARAGAGSSTSLLPVPTSRRRHAGATPKAPGRASARARRPSIAVLRTRSCTIQERARALPGPRRAPTRPPMVPTLSSGALRRSKALLCPGGELRSMLILCHAEDANISRARDRRRFRVRRGLALRSSGWRNRWRFPERRR
jgi:hypothetical protein